MQDEEAGAVGERDEGRRPVAEARARVGDEDADHVVGADSSPSRTRRRRRARWPPISSRMPVPWTRRYGPAGRFSAPSSRPELLADGLHRRVDRDAEGAGEERRRDRRLELAGDPRWRDDEEAVPVRDRRRCRRARSGLRSPRSGSIFGGSVPGGACGFSWPVTCSNSKLPSSVTPPTVSLRPSAFTRSERAGIASATSPASASC